jgi:hypothetical protein
MLEKALFRKHTKLILYMVSRRYFSQKELIEWSLSNKEFKDKDSLENKGQYRDKLISLGILKKYTYKEFSRLYSKETESACKAYREPQERKRCLLEFDSNALVGLDYPKLKGIILPFRDYVTEINTKKERFEISDIVKTFVFGCSIQRILFLNERVSKDLTLLIESKPEIGAELLLLVEKARDAMEKMIKEKITIKV